MKSRWVQPRPARGGGRSALSCVFTALLSAVTLIVVCASGWTLWMTMEGRSTAGGLGVGMEFNEYPRWEGTDRVNILVLGLDQRGQTAGPSRTDTMMVLSVDPVSQSAGLLSIPRDLWVEIPGYGQNRINTAYVLGETQAYPGGGPALAKKTVQHNLGEPIHYYVQLNFAAAEQLVDLIGGVDVYVEREINDPLYPDEAYGYDPLYIPAGWQHMDGRLALKYARSRHGSSDFDRAHRQQQLILAARDKVLRPDVLAQLAPRAGEVARGLGRSVQSDLTLDQVLRLAQLGAGMDPSRLRTAVIDETMTDNWTTPSGAQVLVPNRERMAGLHALIFSPPGDATGSAPAGSARILVQNGTLRPDLAGQCAERLRSQGFQVTAVTNASRSDHASTVILVYTGQWAEAQALAVALGVPRSAVTVGSGPDGAYDIKVILGADYEL